MPFQHIGTFISEFFMTLKTVRAGRPLPSKLHGIEKEKMENV